MQTAHFGFPQKKIYGSHNKETHQKYLSYNSCLSFYPAVNLRSILAPTEQNPPQMEKKGKKRLLRNDSVSGEPLDSSMDSMEETRFRKRNQKLALRLTEKLHFTYNEVECLLLIYYKLQKDSKDSKQGIDKTQFRGVLHCALDMTDDYLMDRIFYTLDRGPSSFMSMETWATSLSLFLRGTLEEKITYCFSVIR